MQNKEGGSKDSLKMIAAMRACPSNILIEYLYIVDVKDIVDYVIHNRL